MDKRTYDNIILYILDHLERVDYNGDYVWHGAQCDDKPVEDLLDLINQDARSGKRFDITEAIEHHVSTNSSIKHYFLNEMLVKEPKSEQIDDPVNHPSHYTNGSIECIDAMESAFGKRELLTYCKIAAFKYIWRCENKGHELQDLEKATWYLNKAVDILEDMADEAGKVS